MGIKLLHAHKGYACFQTRSHHKLTERQLLDINGVRYALAFMPYTGSWEIYNLDNGEEVATIRRWNGGRELVEYLIKIFGVGKLEDDTEGVCSGTA
jgi:hypothetical protein